MTDPRWLRAVFLVGIAYLVIGLGTADLARLGGGGWRLVAWATSAVVFLAHIAYERTRLRSATTTSALHAALAVALGAFGLALAATLRAAATGNYRGAFALALVAWPAMTGIVSFVAAWVMVTAAGLLGKTARESR
ncbi:MAG TPA: hypothetical protein VFP39_14730 [Gemmatimonadales bacterium]|nr:hypothetical protein [Gemmatimonadales bacterium]